MSATLISRATVTDDSGNGTSGDVWGSAQLALWVYDKIDAIFKRTTVGDLTLELENTDTTATSDTGYIARVGSGAAGDAYFQALNGTVTWTFGLDNSDSDAFILAASAALGTTNVLRITTGGLALLNGTTNANMTQGLTLYQGASDDEILSFKSSDVAHGVTGVAETDTFGTFVKVSGASGGLQINGFSEGIVGLQIRGIVTTVETGKNTAAEGALLLTGALKSGTSPATMGANANIVSVRDHTTATRFILDSDGDSHQDVGTAWTNFDTHVDLDLLNMLSAHVTRKDDPLRKTFGSWLRKSRRSLERLELVTFNRDGHHFVNMSRLTMLLTGAVRQMGAQLKHQDRVIGQMQRQLARA